MTIVDQHGIVRQTDGKFAQHAHAPNSSIVLGQGVSDEPGDPMERSEELCWEYASEENDVDAICDLIDVQRAETAARHAESLERRTFHRPDFAAQQRALRATLTDKQREILEGVERQVASVEANGSRYAEQEVEIVEGFSTSFRMRPDDEFDNCFYASRTDDTPAWIDFEHGDGPQDGVTVVVVDPRANTARSFDDGF